MPTDPTTPTRRVYGDPDMMRAHDAFERRRLAREAAAALPPLSERLRNAVTIGDRLTLAREVAGLSVGQAARQLALSDPAQLAAAETGVTPEAELLQPQLVRRLAELYEVPELWLSHGVPGAPELPDGIGALPEDERDNLKALLTILAEDEPIPAPPVRFPLALRLEQLRKACPELPITLAYHPDADPGDGSGWALEVGDHNTYGQADEILARALIRQGGTPYPPAVRFSAPTAGWFVLRVKEEHRQGRGRYWRPGGAGYTDHPGQAGVFYGDSPEVTRCTGPEARAEAIHLDRVLGDMEAERGRLLERLRTAVAERALDHAVHAPGAKAAP